MSEKYFSRILGGMPQSPTPMPQQEICHAAVVHSQNMYSENYECVIIKV